MKKTIKKYYSKFTGNVMLDSEDGRARLTGGIPEKGMMTIVLPVYYEGPTWWLEPKDLKLWDRVDNPAYIVIAEGRAVLVGDIKQTCYILDKDPTTPIESGTGVTVGIKDIRWVRLASDIKNPHHASKIILFDGDIVACNGHRIHILKGSYGNGKLPGVFVDLIPVDFEIEFNERKTRVFFKYDNCLIRMQYIDDGANWYPYKNIIAENKLTGGITVYPNKLLDKIKNDYRADIRNGVLTSQYEEYNQGIKTSFDFDLGFDIVISPKYLNDALVEEMKAYHTGGNSPLTLVSNTKMAFIMPMITRR